MKKLQEMMGKKKELIDENAVDPNGLAENLIDVNEGVIAKNNADIGNMLDERENTLQNYNDFGTIGIGGRTYETPEDRRAAQLEHEIVKLNNKNDGLDKSNVSLFHKQSKSPQTPILPPSQRSMAGPHMADKEAIPQEQLIMEKLKQMLMGK